MKLIQLKQILLEDLEAPKDVVDKLFNSLRRELKYKPEGKYAFTIDGKMYILDKEK